MNHICYRLETTVKCVCVCVCLPKQVWRRTRRVVITVALTDRMQTSGSRKAWCSSGSCLLEDGSGLTFLCLQNSQSGTHYTCLKACDSLLNTQNCPCDQPLYRSQGAYRRDAVFYCGRKWHIQQLMKCAILHGHPVHVGKWRYCPEFRPLRWS